jgi:hypothetical protein
MTTFRAALPDVQDAVLTAIAAALTTASVDVPVDLGHPGVDLRERHIWVDGVFEADLPRYISGGELRDEGGTVLVRCVCTAAGTWEDLRDDALTLVGYVEDAIHEDHSLGGVVQRAFITKLEGDYAVPDEYRRQYGVTVSVTYEIPVGSATP